ncbi:MAG: site-2 protease family protein [Chloroflexi bacterium]|nr:MAG: site-2 protease family protein [Chloroflexota bacterium]
MRNNMDRSLKLFSVRGIDVRLHFTFPLILLWAAVRFGSAGGGVRSALFGVVVMVLVFVLVTLHELGHSFAAMHYGVPVKQIVLSPIGGVAQLQRIPDKPVQEFVIALAGPAVNFAIALLLAAFIPVFGLSMRGVVLSLSDAAGLTITAVFAYIFVYNIILALFNLIPAFPLDGGRVFRALLAMKLDYSRATNVAATVGKVIAVMMGLYGLFNGGIFMVFIALFVFTAAGKEAAMVKQRTSLKGHTVHDVYTTTAYTLTPYHRLEQAIQLMMLSGQTSFPVVRNDVLEGFITRQDLSEAMKTRGGHTWANIIMRRDIVPVSPNMPLEEALKRMMVEELDAIPVGENGLYLGLLSYKRINQVMQWQSGKKHAGKSPFERVVGGT